MKIALLTCRKRPDVNEKEQKLRLEISKELDVTVEIWNDPSFDWASFDGIRID